MEKKQSPYIFKREFVYIQLTEKELSEILHHIPAVSDLRNKLQQAGIEIFRW